MTPTTTPLLEFVQNMPTLILNAFEEGVKQGAHLLWSVLISTLQQHWRFLMAVFFLIFIVATLKAMIGQWGMLGSVLYNLFYFGTLFIVGLIWGPEVFLNDYFNAACSIILYPVCYFLVGWILRKTGVLRYY